VLVQDLEVQLIGPPVCVAWGSGHGVLASAVRERAYCIARLDVLIVDYGGSRGLGLAVRHGKVSLISSLRISALRISVLEFSFRFRGGRNEFDIRPAGMEIVPPQ
jgi:hypothetical protein